MDLQRKILTIGIGVVLILTGCTNTANVKTEAVEPEFILVIEHPAKKNADKPKEITEVEAPTSNVEDTNTKALESKKAIEDEAAPTVVEVENNVYQITAYCACEKCCGKTDGVTATGTIATEGRTIAVDPEVIPYGSKVLINGHTYIAEDCGGAIKGKHIDLFFDSHEDALNWGIQYLEVEIVG